MKQLKPRSKAYGTAARRSQLLSEATQADWGGITVLEPTKGHYKHNYLAT